MNLIMSALCLVMKGLRLVMNGSFVLNSTRLAKFCTALATSLRVRRDASEGLPAQGGGKRKSMCNTRTNATHFWRTEATEILNVAQNSDLRRTLR